MFKKNISKLSKKNVVIIGGSKFKVDKAEVNMDNLEYTLGFYVHMIDEEGRDSEISVSKHGKDTWYISMYKVDTSEKCKHLVADFLFESLVETAKEIGIQRLIVSPHPFGSSNLFEGTLDTRTFGKKVYGKRGFKFVTEDMCEADEFLEENYMYLDL